MVSRRIAPIARREERRGRVADLLLAGKSLSEIASEIGCCKTTASGDVQALRKEWAKSRVETFDEQVAVEERRLRKLLSVYWPAALLGDLDAAEFCVKVIERTCKLLGLDAATRLELGIDIDAKFEITASVEWIELRGRLLKALQPFPEARGAVAAALAEANHAA